MSKFVVVDEILEQLDAAKSGVVPGSVTQSVVSGIQNVPANIIQKGLSAGGGCYTTFPLSPIVKNCCIDQTYLNLEFDINMLIKVSGNNITTSNNKLPFYIGFRDSAAIFNQLQILIENSAIYTTTYQREESVVAYNSLPETEIRGNNQYASIEKIKFGKYCPMKRVVIDIPKGDYSAAAATIPFTIHYKLTVDINRLCPLLSNLHYTTPHFGNLRLKVWLQRIQEAMFVCPDYSYMIGKVSKDNTTPSINAVLNDPLNNQYWSFYPLATIMSHDETVIPFYYYSEDANTGISRITKVNFDINPVLDFMTFNNGIAEIVQKNFEIKEDEYQRLSDYFASTGSIIIPTQTFESQTFNNSNIPAGSNWVPTQIGTVGGYNINFITTWNHPLSQATCFNKEFLTNIQLLLDGRPVNALPYSYINDKCIVDCTQAIIDTDHEEINADYISSLSCFNLTDTPNYTKSKFKDYYSNGDVGTSIHCVDIRNPNTFCLNFSTNLPDAFHSGACILENSNRNGVVRFNSNSASDTVTELTNTDDNNSFPFVITHKNIGRLNSSDSTVVGFTAFCDCCIVLTYDPVRGTCFDGQLSWSSPYI